MRVLPRHKDSVSRCPDFLPGDHLCCFFEDDADRWNAITHYIRQGLLKGEKTVIILHETPQEEVIARLQNEGVDPAPALSSGALRILVCTDVYLKGGYFSPSRMLMQFEDEIKKAENEGYPAFRILGDALWALEEAPGSEHIVEYECHINSFFSEKSCIALCLYDLRRFSSDMVMNVLMAHPRFLICSEIYNNPFYVHEGAVSINDYDSVRIRHWLAHFTGREKVISSLREKESETEAFFDITSFIMLVIDRKGRICRINKAGRSLLGVSEQEVLGKKFIEEFVHPEERNAAAWYFYSSPGPGVYESELREGRIVTAYGDIRIIRWRMAVLKDEDGNLSRLIAAGEDITDRKAMSKSLEESEKRYSYLFRSMNKGVIFFSGEGRIIDVNPAAERICGLKRDEMIGVDVFQAGFAKGWEILREDETPIDACLHPIARFLSESTSDLPVTLGLKQPGTRDTRWILISSISHLPLSPGDPRGAVCIFEDISEKREMLKSLQDMIIKFRAIFYNAHIPMALVDATGHIRDINDAGCSFLGYGRDELAGKKFPGFCLPEDRQVKENMFSLLMKGSVPVLRKETPFLRKDGTVIWGDTTLSRVEIPKAGQMALVICQDISGKKILEGEKQEALRQINKNILQLATLNDEIRNPLAVIVSLADLETGTETATKIIEQANLINEIVYRIDHGWSDSEKVRRFLMMDHGDRAQ